MPRARPPSDEYLALLAAGPGRESTRSILDGVARRFGSVNARELHWHTLRRPDIIDLRDELARSGSLATARRTLTAVRRVLRICYGRRRIPHAAWVEIADVPPPRGKRKRAGRALSAEEIGALLDACGAGDHGMRDAAAIVLMAGFGLRRSEAASVRVEHYDPDAGELSVTGKGNRDRVTACLGTGPETLDAWLDRRGRQPGPIICRVYPIRPTEAVTGARIGQRLEILRVDAGLEHCTPHDLRRAFATRALEAGLDIAEVAVAAGHASPETTSLYDRRSWSSISRKLRAVPLTR